ncbi:MAG: HAMP domain-containing sensor histidine kinase [Oscillospiraceae bacterium]
MKSTKTPRSIPLGQRLTFLVVLMMTAACILLTYAINVSGDQMAYSIYQSQHIITPGTPENQLPSVSKPKPDSDGPLPKPLEEKALSAEFKYRIESIIYVICTICVAGLATYMITENCLFPLVNLKEQVSELSAANLSGSSIVALPKSGDEIESLSNAFNKMRQRLDEAFETQKRFSASAAHELRTPLSVLQTKLDVFSKEEQHTKEEYDALLATVGTQTERLSLLVKDLLDMSCMEEVSMDATIRLAPMLEEIALDLAPAAEKKGITFSLTGDAAIRGNDRLILRALFNLAENAVKYGKVDGHILLEAETAENAAIVRISDDGPGIPQEHHDQIFEPFYRIDKSRSRTMGGAGLGLPMTRAITERHRGRIVLTENPDGGATFTLTFPSAANVPE